jgi:hypothetical protein
MEKTMEEVTVTVASYNMSFMSDLTTKLEEAQWASETTFLASNTGDRRAYWKNALDLLDKFISENKNKPCVIGLQEMNLVKPSEATESAEATETTGSAAVDKMLEKHTGYIQICKEIVVKENQKPALSIIFDTNIFGKEKHSEIIDNINQEGRPLLMVLTDKNYLFVNMHGAQKPLNGNNKMKFNTDMINMNKKFLEQQIFKFLNKNNFSGSSSILSIFSTKKNTFNMLAGAFIMGDFNDRYDAITEFTILEKTLKYTGDSPYSCCHNWDSSCKDERYIPLKDERYPYEDTGTGTCNKDTKEVGNAKAFDEKREYTEITTDDNGKITKKGKKQMDEEEGFIKNYRYKGDKVFGEIPASEIQIFREDTNKNSTESDHELVYAKFIIPATTTNAPAGGKRSSRKKKVVKNRKTKKARTKRNKKSRKYSWM